MKIILITFYFFCAYTATSQENRNYLIGKSFIANVDYMCEETTPPDPCAGQQIYLVLEFKSEEVHIFEKYVSSCKKESLIEIGNFKWTLLATNELKLFSEAEKIKYTYLKNLHLELNKEQILGKRKDNNNNIMEYFFLAQ